RRLRDGSERLARVAGAGGGREVDVEELGDVDQAAGLGGDAVARDHLRLVGGAREDVGRRAGAGLRIELELHDRRAEIRARVQVRVGERADVGHEVEAARAVAAHVDGVGAEGSRPAEAPGAVGRGVAHLARAIAPDADRRQGAGLARRHTVGVRRAQVRRPGPVRVLAAVERVVGGDTRSVGEDGEGRPAAGGGSAGPTSSRPFSWLVGSVETLRTVSVRVALVPGATEPNSSGPLASILSVPGVRPASRAGQAKSVFSLLTACCPSLTVSRTVRSAAVSANTCVGFRSSEVDPSPKSQWKVRRSRSGSALPRALNWTGIPGKTMSGPLSCATGG